MCGRIATAYWYALTGLDLCSLGGVLVTSSNGRIVVNNTLDARLRIVEEEQLPTIRARLFD
jgi:vacuolar-type H+-ATPase subunit E/Vma4